MRVLGIESSCDDTGIAIFDTNDGLIANFSHTQISIHQKHGGVVPELASRDHVKYFIPLLNQALQYAKLSRYDLDVIAYTAGPGLIGSLLSGACFAKSLALSLNKPTIAINHLEAHILAAKLSHHELDFPFLALLLSGGHTQLIVALELDNYILLGETLDDAIGEAFDKTAKLIGLSYPGGAALANLADNCSNDGRNLFAAFPQPMTNKAGLDFSFSGLKTHALTTWQNSNKNMIAKMAIAYAFQHAVINTITIKCQRALKNKLILDNNITNIVVAGGVSANFALRTHLSKYLNTSTQKHIKLYFPDYEFCTDNGAMIAFIGSIYAEQKKFDETHHINIHTRWPLNLKDKN